MLKANHPTQQNEKQWRSSDINVPILNAAIAADLANPPSDFPNSRRQALQRIRALIRSFELGHLTANRAAEMADQILLKHKNDYVTMKLIKDEFKSAMARRNAGASTTTDGTENELEEPRTTIVSQSKGGLNLDTSRPPQFQYPKLDQAIYGVHLGEHFDEIKRRLPRSVEIENSEYSKSRGRVYDLNGNTNNRESYDLDYYDRYTEKTFSTCPYTKVTLVGPLLSGNIARFIWGMRLQLWDEHVFKIQVVWKPEYDYTERRDGVLETSKLRPLLRRASTDYLHEILGNSHAIEGMNYFAAASPEDMRSILPNFVLDKISKSKSDTFYYRNVVKLSGQLVILERPSRSDYFIYVKPNQAIVDYLKTWKIKRQGKK